MPEGSFSNSELLGRLSALYNPAVVADVWKGLAEARALGYLNPVRAGMVTDPAEYRWSSYGEAMAAAELAQLERGRNVALRKMLRFRVRYFTDCAVIGSREFVDEVFREGRERFGPKRKTGARKLRGAGSAAAGLIWSARDLREEIG